MIKKIFKKEKYIIIGALLLLIMNELMEVGVVIFDRRLIDAALTGSIDGIWSAAGLCVLAGVISITVFVISDIINAVCVNRIGLYLRSNLFDSIFRHGRKTVSEFDTADLISRMTNDVKQFTGNCVSFAYYLIMGVLSLIGSAVLMFYYQPIVALIAIALAATMLIIPKLCAKKVEALSKIQSEGASKFTESIQNIFEGLEVVFNYNLKDKMKNSFERENKELTAKSQRLDVLKSFMNMAGQSFSCVGNVLLLIASAYFVYEGKMTIGALAVFITLNSSFTSATQMIIQFYPIVIGIAISLKDRLELSEEEDMEGKAAPTFGKSLKFENLNFGYEEDKPLFSNMSLNIERGKKYAVTGKNGTGKSTLIRLLSGYIDKYEGEILFDGTELKDLNQDRLNEICAIIGQNAYLFDDTILENITFGENYSKEEIDRVVKLCGIDKIREGLNTNVGEKGKELSGGQRQRVAIARALIRHTPLLIIDEGMNAIDEEGNNELWETLLNDKDLTIVSVTHDLSKENLAKYDEVLSLEDMKIELKMAA